ncbi:hypothetical protein PIB30_092050 [Stylosanthes scabra]|uniref:Uncharacterized protein n=1 Tax=Stylosanthes scabra TaxID=79078 RepID=A0ABU6QV83_9FABA|nr:hypothetical protein [Stylosanthes scabra]
MEISIRVMLCDFHKGNQGGSARGAEDLMVLDHLGLVRATAPTGLPCRCEWFGGVIAKNIATDRVFVLDVDGQPSPRTPTNNKDRVVNPRDSRIEDIAGDIGLTCPLRVVLSMSF